MTLLDLHWRFTAEDFHKMAEIGVIPTGRLELVDGEVRDQVGRPFRFTVADYYRMSEAGILKPQDRVELIEGEVVEMAPIGSRHVAAINRLTRQLIMQAGPRAIVSVQNPLHLDEKTMPQPDIVVLEPRDDDYADSLPGASNVLLLVEVADSSLLYDARQKLRLYAGAGILEYWLVDLVRGQFEIYREPRGESFASQRTAARADEVSRARLPQVRIRVAEIIG